MVQLSPLSEPLEMLIDDVILSRCAGRVELSRDQPHPHTLQAIRKIVSCTAL